MKDDDIPSVNPSLDKMCEFLNVINKLNEENKLARAIINEWLSLPITCSDSIQYAKLLMKTMDFMRVEESNDDEENNG